MARKHNRKFKVGWNSSEKFEVKTLQIMDESGKTDSKLMPKLTDKTVKEMYKFMVFGRGLDDKMLALQRQGRIGTFAQIKGQEATNIGAAFALDKEDWIFPAFRENPALIYRGLPPENLIEYYGWDERGNKIPDNVNEFPTAVPVATQTLHAVGFAWAAKLQKKKTVVATFFGDGATSEGDFHEAMNFAGVFKLPVVFICQNNQFAISLPREKQTASKTLAQKAIAYGFEGVQVDGNDIFAVYKSVKGAVDKARKGGGPTLIECYTYRLGDHTTSDDASRYRTDRELAEWKKKDPIDRLRKYMENKKIWDKKQEQALQKDVQKKVEDAVKKAESIPKPSIEDIFKYMYAEMTPELREQLEYLKSVESD